MSSTLAAPSFETPEKPPTWLGLQAPRYTSYPSAQHFHAGVNADLHASWLASIRKDQTVSAYVHIPFCRELCWFCGCHTKMTYRDEPIEKYVRVLLDEIALIGKHAAGKGILKQIHFGGGSPSLLNESQLMSILYALASAFEFAPPGELAIELDPRTTSEEKIAFYGSLGFTRVSMGIQDFDPKVQKAVNRIQSFEMVAGLMKRLHEAGIHQINTDLIYGLPYQTVTSFEHTLKQTLSLTPSRIALFSYAHVPHMKKHQRLIDEHALPDDRTKLTLYRMATEFLLANGYTAIGIDHFARADDSLTVAANSHRMRRNFQGYVTDTTDILLGFGTSAISQFPGGYTQNYSATHEYSKRIEAGQLATCRGWKAGAQDSFRKEIIDTLMCYMEADIGQIAAKHGQDANICARELTLLQECAYSDIAHTKGNLVQIATPYRMASRAVAAVFDQYQLPDSARIREYPNDGESHMKNLDRFRHEHAEILGIAYEIRHLLQPDHVSKNAGMLHALLAQLTRKTLAHLLHEDRSVYQELLLSEHEPTRMLARNHAQSMGCFADSLKHYLNDWPDTQTLARKPKQFCEQTQALIADLERRIDHEERGLYPFSEGRA